VYEKGLADWKPGPNGHAVPTDTRGLVRVEAEIKPNKPFARRLASQAGPAELFGVSPVLRAFAERALNVTVEPISLRVRRDSNRHRALTAMGHQYQRHLADLLTECQGDLQSFGEAIARYASLANDDDQLGALKGV